MTLSLLCCVTMKSRLPSRFKGNQRPTPSHDNFPVNQLLQIIINLNKFTVYRPAFTFDRERSRMIAYESCVPLLLAKRFLWLFNSYELIIQIFIISRIIHPTVKPKECHYYPQLGVSHDHQGETYRIATFLSTSAQPVVGVVCVDGRKQPPKELAVKLINNDTKWRI